MNRIIFFLLIILAIVLIVVGSLSIFSFLVYRSDIKDAKNMFFQGDKLVDMTSLSDGQIIVTEMENHKNIFIDYMKKQGWEYQAEEQLGSQCCFKSSSGEKRFFISYPLVEVVLWIEQ